MEQKAGRSRAVPVPLAVPVEQKAGPSRSGPMPRAAPGPDEPKRKRGEDSESDAATDSDEEEETPRSKRSRREEAESSSEDEEEEEGEKPVKNGSKDGQVVFHKGHWLVWHDGRSKRKPKGWANIDPSEPHDEPDLKQRMRKHLRSLLDDAKLVSGEEGQLVKLPRAGSEAGAVEFIYNGSHWTPKNLGIRVEFPEFDLPTGKPLSDKMKAALPELRRRLQERNKLGLENTSLTATAQVNGGKRKKKQGGYAMTINIHWVEGTERWEADDPDIRQALLAESDE